MKLPSFSRIILPILAVLGMGFATSIVVQSKPDRSPQIANVLPPKTPETQSGTGSVAGSGLVEPSSELVDIGTALPGVIEAVSVTAGAQVAAGAALFRIDTRDAIAALLQDKAQQVSAAAAVSYRLGIADFLSVLDAQRTLNNTRQTNEISIANQAKTAVRLYIALGGLEI